MVGRARLTIFSLRTRASRQNAPKTAVDTNNSRAHIALTRLHAHVKFTAFCGHYDTLLMLSTLKSFASHAHFFGRTVLHRAMSTERETVQPRPQSGLIVGIPVRMTLELPIGPTR